MDWVETLVVVVHVVIAVALVGLVLIQQGKGADAGAAFGGGASQTVFGSQGSGSFLTRFTTLLAVVFFVTSFSLAILPSSVPKWQAKPVFLLFRNPAAQPLLIPLLTMAKPQPAKPRVGSLISLNSSKNVARVVKLVDTLS